MSKQIEKGAVRDDDGNITGFICLNCQFTFESMLGDYCSSCRDKLDRERTKLKIIDANTKALNENTKAINEQRIRRDY